MANVGPIGCIPYQRDVNPISGDDCVEFPNQVGQAFNEQLKSLVSRNSQTLFSFMPMFITRYYSKLPKLWWVP